MEEPYLVRETLSLPSPLSQAPRLTIPPSDIIPNVFDPPLALLPHLPSPPSPPSPPRVSCRYCQCFARQSMCTQACRCENCHNSAQHDVERQAAVKELLCRSPNAFGAKFTTEVPCVCVYVCVCVCIYEGAHYRAIRRNFLSYEYFYLYVFCLYCLLSRG